MATDKPIVFLSHSALDKAPLIELKKLLDARAAGFLDFFLSSDGESIRFGRNWVVRVSDALSKAKLMFVFLSPQSANSKWMHFEAGCAYANGVQVVPVCLPGFDLNRMTPPLSLLQGFNLHSSGSMANLARVCNDTFKTKINESFTEEDFNCLAANTLGDAAGFFGANGWTVGNIRLSGGGKIPSPDFNPIVDLEQICSKAKMRFRTAKNDSRLLSLMFEQAGVYVHFSHQTNRPIRPNETPLPETFDLWCQFSVELFHINAPLFDEWLERMSFPFLFHAAVSFNPNVECEKQRERLTSQFYHQGIHLTNSGRFEFNGFEFSFGERNHAIGFELRGKLHDKRLIEILDRAVKSGAVRDAGVNLLDE